MGAYLHLRSLTELDELSDSDARGERFQYLSGPDSGALAASSTRTSGVALSSREGNSSAAVGMDDCSNFWAGQMDVVFEEPQVTTGYRNTARARMELSGNLQRDVDTAREQGLESNETGSSGSRTIGSMGDASIKGQLTEDSPSDSVGSRTASGSFHGSLINGSPLITCRTGGEKDTATAATFAGSCATGAELRSERGTEGTWSGGNASKGSEDEQLHLNHKREGLCQELEDESERLPDHLLIELLVRVPTRDWPAAACVKKRWAQLFKGDGLWHCALVKKWPTATSTKRWPGPIARGSSKRRYTALDVSDSLFARDKVEGVNEVAGHVYLFLKEQLEASAPPVSYGLLHGTVIDQFLACCKTGDEAHDLASLIWVAVLDNLDESENTFHLLMRIAEEWEVFLPYPYSKSRAVQWRLFERLFTDFRDCLSQYNYFDVLTRARTKFELIPQTWLGY